MGFDVYGKKPKNKKGEYFRNNVWWWRRLWQFVCAICPDLIKQEEVESGQMNNGQAFSAVRAVAIATRIDKAINTGTATVWKKEIDKEIKKIKKHNKKKKSGDKGFIWGAEYPFTIQNLKNFSKFCRSSGGFEIC